MKIRIAALLTIAALASVHCGQNNESAVPTKERVHSPKADDAAIGRMCLEMDQPPDCDICQVMDWYGDDVCDNFCHQPDPDCQPGYCLSDLPADFDSEAEGSGDTIVDVEVELVASSAPGCTRPDFAALEDLLVQFVSLHSAGQLIPDVLTPEASIYKIADPEGATIHVGNHSSMGRESQEMILGDFQHAIGDEGGGCTGFSLNGYNLVNALLEYVQAKEFGGLATALADIIIELASPDRTVQRQFYSRGCELDSWSGLNYLAFFIVPSHYSQQEGFMFVLRTGWSE
jgi:hypothetical protein